MVEREEIDVEHLGDDNVRGVVRGEVVAWPPQTSAMSPYETELIRSSAKSHSACSAIRSLTTFS